MPAPKAAKMVDLARFDPRLKLDIRYAGTNNFTGRALYAHACAWLQREAAEALRAVHGQARAQGLGLLILDAYRPWRVTRALWEDYPEYRDFIADPAEGSVHNRGCAVDLTLFDPASGRELAMPSDYDEFDERAYPSFAGGDPARLANRDLLRALMAGEGFAVHPREWWHFDHRSWPHHPVLDIDFDDLP